MRDILIFLILLLFPTLALGARLEITTENQRDFRLLQDTAFACHYNSQTQSVELGKIRQKGRVTFQALTLKRLNASLSKRIKNLKKKKARASGAKVKALRKKIKKQRGDRKALPEFETDCEAFNPVTCASCNTCPSICSAPMPNPEGGVNPSTPTPSPSGSTTPTPSPSAPFTAPYVWTPISFDDANDLGHVATEIPAGEQQSAGAVNFADMTNTAGLAGVIGGGNQHGVGIAFVDLNGDTWADIFVVNGTSNVSATTYSSAYWRNNQDGTFTNVTASSGVAAILNGTDGFSVAASDFNNDGDVDLYIGAHPRDFLLANQGNGNFVDGTLAAAAGGPNTVSTDSASKIVSFGDYDGDGHQDIVSASSELPTNNLYLLRNLGNGKFQDTTNATSAFAAPGGNPCAVLWNDYDSDGDKDLAIWNDRNGGPRVLLRNDNGGSFTDVAAAANWSSVSAGNPMGIDAADIDHDGDLDFYVSDVAKNPLLRQNDNGTFTNITFSAQTAGDFGWGLGFEDFNNDTWADIFVGQEDGFQNYLAFTNLAQSPPLFSQARFAHAPILDSNRAHNVAVAFADYDHDGRVDVVTATTDGSRINLFRNVTPQGTHRWLEVIVTQVPVTGERGGVGARVIVKTGDTIQFRDINGGSSRASQNELSARFGLGNWSGAEWVAVLWPDGRQLVVTGVAGNRQLLLPAVQ